MEIKLTQEEAVLVNEIIHDYVNMKNEQYDKLPFELQVGLWAPKLEAITKLFNDINKALDTVQKK